MLGRSHDSVDERHQADHHGGCTKQIQLHLRSRERLAGGQQPYGTGRDHNPDRDVDEEDPLPTKQRRNDATKDHADSDAGAAAPLREATKE